MVSINVGDGPGPEPADPVGHHGFVAGRYRDWSYSDEWTDVRRCAERTFTAYLPTCTCGWSGVPMPADEVGLVRCHRAVRTEHLVPLRHRAALSVGIRTG